jgi:hypothetical protein
MKEIIYVTFVTALALVLSSTLSQVAEIHQNIKDTELRIERMQANPRPDYVRYPFSGE